MSKEIKNEVINIKGIEFKIEDLETIKLEDLFSASVSPGHIFVRSRVNGHPFLLLRASDLIEDEFIRKYSSAGITSFYILKLVNSGNVTRIKNLLRELKNVNSSVEAVKAREKILDEFFKVGRVTTSTHCLDFIAACFDEFNLVSQNSLEKYYGLSTHFYQRSLVLSTWAVVISLLNGSIDYYFIQDIFNTAFYLDIGIVEDAYSFHLFKACEEERSQVGGGVTFLKSIGRPQNEIDSFLNHPINSYKQMEKVIGKFRYPEIANFVQYHHESSSGDGFPFSLNRTNFSSFEMILSLVDKTVPYDEIVFNQNFNVFENCLEQLGSSKEKLFTKLCDKLMKNINVIKHNIYNKEYASG
ncbi:hypothetical protein N9N67_03325 [Bacteriovoracaceae bacterium]|nr:hypothetical protein [Bacteriovoracaceae bacterium]